MKLNNTQIKALAQEVLNKIPEPKKEFTKEQLTKYTKIVNEYKKLEKEIDLLLEKQKSLRDPIYELGDFYKLYDDNFLDIKNMEKKLDIKDNRPTLEEIIHKITLETIFETKDSMNDFIDNLVKQYTK